ncbi:MAG: cbb3-type cytochrome c oxidase subunit I [Rubrivivax sp.]
MATTYRTCPRSGLQFERNAETLMKVNAFVAVVWLLIGGLLAIGVVLTRWPAFRWLEADTFYMTLTAHGIDMLIFWIIFFEIAVLYFCASTLLRSRLATPKMAWLAFALMLIGSITNNVAVFRGSSSVMMTSYVPMMAEPSFYLGLILFAVGALIGCFVFFGTLVVAKREKTYEGSVPLVVFGAITAAIIAVFTIASGAIILIPTWLMSIGVISEVNPLMYRTIWWAFGHSSQQINVAAHISVWYLVAAVAFGAKSMSERVSRVAFLLYILFLQLASAHHLLADPGLSTGWKGRQHQLLHVLRGAGVDAARPDDPRRDGKSRSGRRASPRACSSGCARRRGATRRSPACSSPSSASASSAASPA